MPSAEWWRFSAYQEHVFADASEFNGLRHETRIVPTVISFYNSSEDDLVADWKYNLALVKVKEEPDDEVKPLLDLGCIQPRIVQRDNHSRVLHHEHEESKSDVRGFTIDDIPDDGKWNTGDNLSGLPWGSFSFMPHIGADRLREENLIRGGSTIKGEEVKNHQPSTKMEENQTPVSELDTTSVGYDPETDYKSEGDSPGSYRCAVASQNLLLGTLTHDQDPQHTLLKPMLSPVKQKLVDQLMKEFWIIFNQEWGSKIKSCASTPSTSAEFPGSQTISQISSKPQNRKRRLEDNNDPDSDGERGRTKRSNPAASPPMNAKRRVHFACPYRKHDSRKYNVTQWRSCALTPLATVARVKGHLYRHHMIFQCQRCKDLFKDQLHLDSHFTRIEGCELIAAEPAEGITASIEKRLRSRKKTRRDQSEEDRWREIYQVLFPTDDTPSPYFEAIQDDPLPQSPESQELTNYEEYSRRELPRIFRAALEVAVNDESEPIAERLLRQLPDLIRDCQDSLFANYRAKVSSSGVEVPCHRPPSPRREFPGPYVNVAHSSKGPETASSRDTGYESYSSPKVTDGNNKQSSPSSCEQVEDSRPESLQQTQEQSYALANPDILWGPYPTEIEMEFLDWNQSSEQGIL